MRWDHLLIPLLLLSACGGGSPGPDSDAGGDTCVADTDCDDLLFCNGVETCDPSNASADAAGCVVGLAPCTDACMEATDTCGCDTDADGDGAIAIACGGNDCDDDDADRFPGNTEVCDAEGRDEDCDPSTLGGLDADEDGAVSAACCNLNEGALVCGQDCDDARANVSGLATEACDGIDNDCDGATDEGVQRTFHPDVDEDSFGDADGTPMTGCTPPAGYVEDATDCDDDARTINPLAAERCDTGVDEDCDGATDEAGAVRYYRDADDDAYGDAATFMDSEACEPPAGYVTVAGDCNDTSDVYHPGADDPCDGRDTNCNLASTPGATDSSEDMDDDGHAATDATCTVGDVGFGSFPKDDCDDAAATVHPGAVELCDRRDNTCASGGGVLESEDMDGDGHAATDAACSGGYSRDDCNDDAPNVYLGAPEVCDRVDNGCASGGGVDLEEDMDDDGHAPTDAPCSGGPRPKDDCDDTVATTYMGAPELCNRVDDACAVDGGVRTSEDMDDDGYAPIGADCAGGPRPRTDCDDTDSETYPGAVERCGGGNQDCDADEDEDDVDAALYCGPHASCTAAGTCRVEGPVAAGGDSPDNSSYAMRGTVVHGWGSNSSSALAAPPTESMRPNAAPVDGVAAARAVFASYRTACAFELDGTLVCWGDGRPFAMASPLETPMPVGPAIEVSLGYDTACVRSAGQVQCWGTNASGALGDGTRNPRATPAVVVFDPAAPADAARQLASGRDHHCALLRDGTVQCWGEGTALGRGIMPEPGDPDASLRGPGAVVGVTDAIEIAAGDDYTCAVHADRRVSCWGELGDSAAVDPGDVYLVSPTPTLVAGLTDVHQLAVGGDHVCARLGDGSVSCFGVNEEHQLGDGTAIDRATPAPVTGVDDATFITAGERHTCVTRATGAVACWGSHEAGALGDGATDELVPFPVPVAGLTDATDVFSVGGGYCAARMGGGLVCWGVAPVGDGSTEPATSPVSVGGADAIAASGLQSARCLLRSGGAAACWGRNHLGSATTSSDTPVPVTSVTDASVLGHGPNATHGCVAGPSGLACWGSNEQGQLGTDDTIPSTSPVASAFSFAGGIDAIGLGTLHTCVAHGGGVSCFGAGGIGNLGDGLSTSSQSPVSVSGLSGVVEVGTGQLHSCALHASGTVSCWGYNQFGMLGDGTTTTRPSPVAVTGIDDAVDLAVGSVNGCVVRAGGEVWCWGPGGSGELGNGSYDDSLVAVPVRGLTDATHVAATGGACARRAAGEVVCWGQRRMLGNPMWTSAPSTPVAVAFP